jgi:hypothetical protein
MDTPEFLTGAQAAKLLGCNERTLANMRVAGTGPKFIPLGAIGSKRPAIRYPRNELDAWIQSRLVRSTAERDLRDGKAA